MGLVIRNSWITLSVNGDNGKVSYKDAPTLIALELSTFQKKLSN